MIDVPLSEEEQQNFVEWLNQKSTIEGGSCPVCGGNGIDLERGSITFKRESGGGQVNLSNQLPVIVSACDNCGHIRLFNEGQVDL